MTELFEALGIELIAEGVEPRLTLGQPDQQHRERKRDLAQQRGAFAFFVSFAIVFVALSAAGSYRAYEFTDSIQFCGQLFTDPGLPEVLTYRRAP